MDFLKNFFSNFKPVLYRSKWCDFKKDVWSCVKLGFLHFFWVFFDFFVKNMGQNTFLLPNSESASNSAYNRCIKKNKKKIIF